jgi:gliding motility-associated-like protein
VQSKDTVSARFNYQVKLGCVYDTIRVSHNGANHVNSWHWNITNNIISLAQDTSIVYSIFGDKTFSLAVSNGTCTDSATVVIPLNNYLEAKLENTAVVCPNEPATFKDKSIGTIRAWKWDFGNGSTSTLPAPAGQYYITNNITQDITTSLIVKNDIGCSDTAYSTLRVVGNCYIAVPKAFTPNGDGLNDFLYPTNAYKATNLIFMVYNRLGQKVFETTNWQIKWNGKFKGNPLDPGTYVWYLKYKHIDTGQWIEQKGTTVLLR